MPSKNVFNYTICIAIRSAVYKQLNRSFLFMAQGDVSLQKYNFIALRAFMACRGATSSYFCSFQMLEVQIRSRPMPFSTISKENNVLEKKKRKTSHVLWCGTVLAAFRCWRLHTKIPFPPRCSFWHAIQRPVRYEACGGWNMNEYVVIYLPFSQHPRLFRGARFRMWGDTKLEKTSQDEISLAVGNLDSRLWRHPT